MASLDASGRFAYDGILRAVMHSGAESRSGHLRAIWEEHYRSAFGRGLSRLSQVDGIVLGFHSVIDGLKHITPEFLWQLLAGEPNLLKEVSDRYRDSAPLPVEINDPADLLYGLVSSMASGKALQLMIRNEETYLWALRSIGYDQLRLGGTSANMARSLAPLPLRKIIVYANPITRELVELFGELPNLYTITPEGELARIMDLRRERGIFALHWILEYDKGLEVRLEAGLNFATPRANRYIAAWNPVNRMLKIHPKFKAELLGLLKSEPVSHMLVSGFHIMSDTYPDGTTCHDHITEVADYLRAVKGANPDLRIHVELASIASRNIRMCVLDDILPEVDSLGLNEAEMCSVMRDLGREDIAWRIERGQAAGVIEGLMELRRRAGLKRVHFHDLGYYAALVDRTYERRFDVMEGMLFAAIMAASRASHGLYQRIDDIREGLKVPVSNMGIERIERFRIALSCSDDFLERGRKEVNGCSLLVIPTKLAEKPKFTVGLGDTISAGAFLAE